MRLIDLVPDCLELLRESLADGRSVSMTDATELIFGTSGRGSPGAVKIIEELARRKQLTITTKGRNRRVSLAAKPTN
jgi:hypothetical protein